ncbi:hypothetical protein ANO14919_140810 [Xylariales sp. No.14919]|nr:hypothetical protein ANO14919_140810 [Xylariales sp. No.14919]
MIKLPVLLVLLSRALKRVHYELRADGIAQLDSEVTAIAYPCRTRAMGRRQATRSNMS